MRTTRTASRPRRPRTPVRPLAVLGLAVLAFGVPALADETELSPWALLENLRDNMQKSGPMTSRFIQTYVPAGFNEGDTEEGHMSMWLPDCLRWNYEKPQSKNFLVCQGEVFYWSEDEPGGRRYKVDVQEEPGMDLLLVPLSTLRQRYLAATETAAGGNLVISLATPAADGGKFSARIQLDRNRERVEILEYTDDEGNLTRFRLTGYERLSHTALFQPPDDIEWTEE